MCFLWRTIEGLGVVLPFLTVVVTVLVFVCRCRMSGMGRLCWLAFVIFACSRVTVFRFIGDTAYDCPLRISEMAVHFLDVLYFGTVFLAVLSVPLFFWRSRLKVFVVPAVAYVVALVGVLNSIATPVVREDIIESDRVPAALDGYRIVHISDIHAYCGCRGWHTQRIVDVANRLDADLVCLTGDFVDGHPVECAEYLRPLCNLKGRDGVYAVTGNHEFADLLNPFEGWKGFYASWGIPFLRNTCVFPRKGLALGGIDDRACYSVLDVPDVAKTFASATNGEFRVLLSHRPDDAQDNIRKHDVGLQLSGHQHGGFATFVKQVVAVCKCRFISGLYKMGRGHLVVSAGCGPLYGFPLRYRTPLEIGLITLRHVQEGALE